MPNRPVKDRASLVEQSDRPRTPVDDAEAEVPPPSPAGPPFAGLPLGLRDSAQSSSLSEGFPPSLEMSSVREKRGSRARRRLSSFTSDAHKTTTSVAGCASGDDVDIPVIDTTSAEVERTSDGNMAKVNEYIVVRDLGHGSTAEVKLCRLVPAFARLSVNGADCNGSKAGTKIDQDHEASESGKEAEDGSDQYAVKIFDRTEIIRRGRQFARPRAKGQDGHLIAGAALPEGLLKVQREIAIMKKLLHQNVVQLIEVIDAPLDSSLYMVMEYVERGAVMLCVQPERGRYASPLTGGCLDAHTAARYLADVLAGLDYLHHNSIAHLDLKPENVLIGADDRAKIADFGVSRYFTDEEIQTPNTARTLQRSDSRSKMITAEGTWCFWAPEMCGPKGEESSAFNAYAADAWAAGATLWCFLYGTVPFFRTSPMELFDAIVKECAPIPDEADEELRHLLLRFLDKDPQKRLTVREARAHDWVRSNGRRPASGAIATPNTAIESMPDTLLNPMYNGCSGDGDGGVATAREVGSTRACRGMGGGGNNDNDTRAIVSVTEEDVKTAVTEAPSFVLVGMIKDRMHGRIQAMRMSNGRGTQHAAIAAGAAVAAFLRNAGSNGQAVEVGAVSAEGGMALRYQRPRGSSFVCAAS